MYMYVYVYVYVYYSHYQTEATPGTWVHSRSMVCASEFRLQTQMPTATRPIINKNNAYRICMGGQAGNPIFPYIPQCSPVIPSFQTLAPRDSRPLHHSCGSSCGG